MRDQSETILGRHRELSEVLHSRLERVREDPSPEHLLELIGCLEHDLLPQVQAEQLSLYRALEPLIGAAGWSVADLDHEFIRRFAGQVREDC